MEKTRKKRYCNGKQFCPYSRLPFADRDYLAGRDYLKDHTLLYGTREKQRRVNAPSKAAHGSILDPDRWYNSYDSLPDELILVDTARRMHGQISSANTGNSNVRVIRWTAEHGISLILEKTEVIVLTKESVPAFFRIYINKNR